MQIQIRKAQPEHEGDIRQCARAAYQRYVAAIGRDPAPMVADFAGLIAQGKLWGAFDLSGQLQGFIVHWPEGEDMLLENVAVHPDWAGRGIGKALIAHCETAARASGARRIRLYTNVKMVENLTLYPHLGYRETDRREEDGFQRVFFEKRLLP